VSTTRVRRRRMKVTRVRRRRKQNPSLRGAGGTIMGGVKSGFVGALGALGLDMLYGFAAPKLPSALTTGPASYLTKALGAVLVGMVGNKLLRGRGRDLVNGAFTVLIHDAAKTAIQQNFPNVPMGEYVNASPIVGYGPLNATPAVPYTNQPATGRPLGAYLNMPQSSGMGAYLAGYTTSFVEGDDWTGYGSN